MSDLRDFVPGQMFTYDGQRRLLGKRVGIGQVLGVDRQRAVVFVELFGVRDEQLVPFIGFVPLTYEAFVRSRPKLSKRLDVPASWEGLRDLWLDRWQAGDAGVFSIPIREVVIGAMKTVGRDKEVDEGAIHISIAFPRRDETGSFRLIETHIVDLA